MPVRCRLKESRGIHYCLHNCPMDGDSRVFHLLSPQQFRQLSYGDREQSLNIAVLDMNHQYPNLGFGAILDNLRDLICDLRAYLERSRLVIRAVTFDVRHRHQVPDHHVERFALYVGSGGPGHIDPYRNDGKASFSQGIREDPSWEPHFQKLMQQIEDDPDGVMIGVCHSFGLMCRWKGIGKPRQRGRRGKSRGIIDNVLTPMTAQHPWFRRLSKVSRAGMIRILDHRLFDLLPVPEELRKKPEIRVLSYEANRKGGMGKAMTMVEFRRLDGLPVPRILATNHHPEIVNRRRVMRTLERKFAEKKISKEFYQDRKANLASEFMAFGDDIRLHYTSDYTFLLPLKYHLYRRLRILAEKKGHQPFFHEGQVFWTV